MIESSAIPPIALTLFIVAGVVYMFMQIWPKKQIEDKDRVLDKIYALEVVGNPTDVIGINAHLVASNIVLKNGMFIYLNNPDLPTYYNAMRTIIAATGTDEASEEVTVDEVTQKQVEEIRHNILQLMNRTTNFKGSFFQTKQDGYTHNVQMSVVMSVYVINKLVKNGVCIDPKLLLTINQAESKVHHIY